VTTQQPVRDWWNRNPMSYDVDDPIPHEPRTQEFFRETGDLAADVFASQSFRERGFVNAGAARRRLEQHQSGERTAGNELWRALCVELWAREFLSRATT
jgi:asparagine synthase